MKKKTICICITNYKKEKFIDRAIRSAESQLQQNFNIEIIVVNDGSKKFNKEKFSLEYPYIKIIDYKKNKGVSYASNRAIFYCNSEYFMRVDADDYLSIRACIVLITFFDYNSNYPFIYGDITKINNHNKDTIIKRDKLENLLEHGAGVLFKTSILKKLKGYDEKIKNCEDYDLLARIIRKYGKGLYVPFSYYRYYKTNLDHLTKNKNRKKLLKKIKKKYDKYLQ
jgi:glycosyltransferase involved in cell wall biosynthesis